MNKSLFLLLCIILLASACAACLAVTVTLPEVPYATNTWIEERGNHRAVVHVSAAAAAVKVRIPWRRRDNDCASRAIWVYDATTGNKITNVVTVSVSREYGDVIFQPASATGDYYVYYRPYVAPTGNFSDMPYYAPENTSDPAWVSTNHLSLPLGTGVWNALPSASVTLFEARMDLDRVDPMEVISTSAEMASLLAAYPSDSYMLFAEDRTNPIKMADDLPVNWVKREPTGVFSGTAQPNEYYAFQIGVYAARQAITTLSLQFSDMTNGSGKTIPSFAFNCISLDGVDWLGAPFYKTFGVGQGRIRPLWINVQVPSDASGTYQGDVIVRPLGMPQKTIHISLDVGGAVLADKGDSEPWRHSRLRWLDSTLGLDDEVIPPYTPVQVNGDSVSILNRQLTFASTGLPTSIVSSNRQILSRQVNWVARTPTGTITWTPISSSVVKTSPGTYVKSYTFGGGSLLNTCKVTTEFDGCVSYEMTVSSTATVYVTDINLEVPVVKSVAKYMMGFSKEGGYRPTSYSWRWDVTRADNMVWLGDYNAGLQCKLIPETDKWTWDLVSAGLPVSWYNGGSGGATVTESANEVVLKCYSGARTISAGQSLKFNFRFLVTPFKTIDPDHWNWRYDLNIAHLHHGTWENPYINYPFLRNPELKGYVDANHGIGNRAVIYYTSGQLSNHATELWALRGLDEVYTTVATPYPYSTNGAYSGGAHVDGYPWLKEHLIYNYDHAWLQPLGWPGGDVDTGLVTVGVSRWHNYYVEGLQWLLDNVGIDGLYLDGIGYNRDIMKRVRKTMLRADTDSVIKTHFGNDYAYLDHRVSPMNEYMEHLPYLSDLWVGEMYDYSKSADYWFVEVSGIPFGLTSEMLEYSNGGNPYRGMVYGMTGRLHPTYRSMTHYWDVYGIQDAQMIGYWDPSCPVQTGRSDVLATVYKKSGRMLVALASWASSTVNVNLTFDWAALKLNPVLTKTIAPAISGFQSSTTFATGASIPVEAGKGWLIEIGSVVDPNETVSPTDSRVIYSDNFETANFNTRYAKNPSSAPAWTYTPTSPGYGLSPANSSTFATRPYLNGRFANTSYTVSMRMKCAANHGPWAGFTLLNNGYSANSTYRGYNVNPYNMNGSLVWFVNRTGSDNQTTSVLSTMASPVTGINMNDWYTVKGTVDVRTDETLLRLRWEGLATDGSAYVDERVIHDRSPQRWTAGQGLAVSGYPGDDLSGVVIDDLVVSQVFYEAGPAKIALDGVKAWLTDAYVSCVLDDCIYVQTGDRLHGIRVNTLGYGLVRGDRVSLTGLLGTTVDGERAIIPDGIEYVGESTAVEPLGMTNAVLGGSGDRYDAVKHIGQQGITNGVGVNNIGLLVRTTGKVKSLTSGGLIISDGSIDGLMIDLPTGVTAPAIGHSVVATGISSLYTDGLGARQRLLRVSADSADLHVVAP